MQTFDDGFGGKFSSKIKMQITGNDHISERMKLRKTWLILASKLKIVSTINIGFVFLPVVEMVGLDYRSAVVAVFMIWWALAYSAMAGSAYVLNHWRHMSVAYGAYELLLVIIFAL